MPPRDVWLRLTCPTNQDEYRVPIYAVRMLLEDRSIRVPCKRCAMDHRYPLDENSLDLLLSGGFDPFPDHLIPRPKAPS